VSAEGDRANVEQLSAELGVAFRDPALLERALTHRSYAFENGGLRTNERLEFLGDAVLDLVVSEALFAWNPDWSEGQLSRARASLVRREGLARRAREIGLPELVQLGGAERRSGGAEKDSILANAYEAVIGALYLDAGLAPVKAQVDGWIARGLGDAVAHRDAKTSFQEWAHAALQQTPSYQTIGDTGIEDDDLRFTVEVRVGNAAWGTGVGRTKRGAEIAAAADALERVKSQS